MDLTFQTEEGKFNYRVVAVILYENKLLVSRDNGAPYYCLPGGRVQMGETAEQAITREIHEELNINANIVRPLWLNQAFFKEAMDGNEFHELCVYFLVDISHTTLQTDEPSFFTQEGDKIHHFEWMPINKLKRIDLFPTFLKDEIFDLPKHLEMRVERQCKRDKCGKISVREALPSDVRELCEIQKLAFAPVYEVFHDKGNPYLRGPEDIANRIRMPQRFKYFTILDDDMIVGGACYRTTGSGVFFNSLQKGEYYLQRLFVRPDRQCEGIGRRAMELCEATFEDATAFVVDFPIELESNRACYEAAGFVDTGDRCEIEKGLVLGFFIKDAKKK